MYREHRMVPRVEETDSRLSFQELHRTGCPSELLPLPPPGSFCQDGKPVSPLRCLSPSRKCSVLVLILGKRNFTLWSSHIWRECLKDLSSYSWQTSKRTELCDVNTSGYSSESWSLTLAWPLAAT